MCVHFTQETNTFFHLFKFFLIIGDAVDDENQSDEDSTVKMKIKISKSSSRKSTSNRRKRNTKKYISDDDDDDID